MRGFTEQLAHSAPCRGWLSYSIGTFSLNAQWEVEPGQILTLFGPSGAGKTTVLRAIVGLIRPQQGRIEVGGQPVFDSDAGLWEPPHRRRVGFLTQGYQLFPHLTVASNIGYGLTENPRRERQARVSELLDLFQLRGLEGRRPHQISGGQQQRAALARALAPHPALVLLDEPFSSLDVELRRSLRADLRLRLQEAGIPAIMVTHDIEEAVSMADSVQVINDGQMGPPGPPLDVLGQPGQDRVARLVGVENIIPMTVTQVHRQDGTMVCSGGADGSLTLEVPLASMGAGDRIMVGVRASDIILADAEPRGSSARNRLPGVVTEISLRPPGYEVTLECFGVALNCHITGASLNEMGIGPGANLWAIFKASSCFLVREDG